MESLIVRIVDVARSQVGQRETARNRGPMVDLYVRSVKLDPAGAFSWCAAFVFWVFDHASAQLGQANPLPRSASVHGLWQQAGQRAHQDEPEVGDVFCVDHGQGRGHCGIVVGISDAGLQTVEGNTSAGGSREGDGVYARTRDFGEINMGYLRFGAAS